MRCEASRANDLIDRPIHKVKVAAAQIEQKSLDEDAPDDHIKAYISTQIKKQHGGKPRKSGKARPSLPCLAKDCTELSPFSLCGLHYHGIIAGKTPTLELRDNYGSARFDPATKLIVYPETVPKDRLPSNVHRVKAGAAHRTDSE